MYRPNIPLALIEAKDDNHAVGDGMQQALDCEIDPDADSKVSIGLASVLTPGRRTTKQSFDTRSGAAP
ncbi:MULTISPECIES: hypothetical protein [unclassified Thiocapsa]|uniref:hypothetical protein n=1 Tax=unclassified Thiocapsa TaxID=2641286 RepID=UPI0035ADC68D